MGLSGHGQSVLQRLTLIDLSIHQSVSGVFECMAHPGAGLDTGFDQLSAPDFRLDADGGLDGVGESPPGLEIDAGHGEKEDLRVSSLHGPHSE